MQIPKPNVITAYRSWRNVAAIINRHDILENDFAEPFTQAKEDLETLEDKLNDVWEILISEISIEFFSRERLSLRKLFDIEFSDPRTDILDTKRDLMNDMLNPKASGIYTGGTAIIDNSLTY